jgi:SagB-type dehydrogenase family enzyme
VNDPGPVEVFHLSTCHGERPREPDRLVPFRPLDPRNRPYPFKTYPGLDPVPLPTALTRSRLPAVEVLSGRQAEPRDLDDALLSTVLHLAGGVTRVAGPDGQRTYYRTAMSAGNLHPVEIYVVRGSVHHYDPLGHALTGLRPPGSVGGPRSAALLVLTGIPFRTCWKYGERGWRHLWWDAGTIAANALAVAAAHGVTARLDVGFDDEAVAQLVGVDPTEELPLALIRLGEAEVALPPPGSLEPITARPSPVAPRVVRFPLLEAAHAAGVISEEAVGPWRAAAAAVSRPAAGEPQAPPSGGDGHVVEDVILQRGSTRVFRPGRAAAPLLDWGLPAAARAVPVDAAAGGTLVQHLVSVHDVEGRERGRYRYAGAGGFERYDVAQPTGEAALRAGCEALCLRQPLGGASAYTVFHACEIEPLLRSLGARGYRAAQLEAGVVAERLALSAFALGCGGTGLTFYDDMVSSYFESMAAPLLATAIGIPASPPAPSGSPGSPVELRSRRF